MFVTLLIFSSIALMVFLVAYAVFEVPSNYLLKRLSPSKWIAFLMFSWGAVTMGLGGTKSYGAVTAVRFILGMFEAGLSLKQRGKLPATD
jgi:MFS family permease